MVVLVDEADRPIGLAPRMQAHRGAGMLHRAFSVFIFNRRGEVLLQRRSRTKLLFAGRWTNTCCSHPAAEADIAAQARDRLAFEMGMDATLRDVLTFTYRATDPASGLSEYELDHVLVGRCDDDPTPRADEADDWRWVAVEPLRREIAAHPDRFSPWAPIALEALLAAGEVLAPSG